MRVWVSLARLRERAGVVRGDDFSVTVPGHARSLPSPFTAPLLHAPALRREEVKHIPEFPQHWWRDRVERTPPACPSAGTGVTEVVRVTTMPVARGWERSGQGPFPGPGSWIVIFD